MRALRRTTVCLLVAVGGLGGLSAGAAPSLFFGLRPVAPNRELSFPVRVDDWYRDAAIYHLWVAAFRDSDGDGTGDLNGITQSLDGLRALGINTLWLSPFFKNASSRDNLHGYDVIDHNRVDPRLGTDADIRTLIRETHRRGMRLIFDFVPNHVSDKHPWFQEARNPSSPKREWFVWRDNRPSGWTGFDGHSDWHESGGKYYYGIFWGGMPDINHRNREVRLELARAARFWLDLGFDGMRVDAVRYLFENLDGSGAIGDQEDRPENQDWFASWRREVLDPYTAVGYPKFMVAENWTHDRECLTAYMVRDGEPLCQMTLNFPLAQALAHLDASAVRDLWSWHATLPANAWMANFASNHDLSADRPGTLFADKPEKLRAQTAWLLLGPGTPVIYYGNEIAQPQGPESSDRKHRHPLDWEEITRQSRDTDSVWHWHRRLLLLRRQHASLRRGTPRFLDAESSAPVMVLYREVSGDATLTILNTGNAHLESISIRVPAGLSGQPGAWLLGEGTRARRTGEMLGPVALDPFETKVLHWKN